MDRSPVIYLLDFDLDQRLLPIAQVEKNWQSTERGKWALLCFRFIINLKFLTFSHLKNSVGVGFLFMEQV